MIPSLAPRPDVLSFLASRRSRPAKTLGLPVPDRAALRPMLEMAARSPDHGKLVPWRFVVLERPALDRLAALIPETGASSRLDDKAIAKSQKQYTDGHLAVAVIEVQQPSPKVPAIEQSYAVGGVCLALLNAAQASGWGANWLTGWPCHDAEFAARGLGLGPDERIAGLIYIGTETVQPSERSRPDIDTITTWMSE